MTTAIKKRIISEMNDLPDDKAISLLDYLKFLKSKNKGRKEKKINSVTRKAFQDTDNGKNLIKCKNADDMFKKLGI